MASFSRSSSEDSEQERESEDSDRILMAGGPVEPYQEEPLAVYNSDSDESDSEEDEDGLSPAVLEARYDREVAVATWCSCNRCNNEFLISAREFRCCREVLPAVAKLNFDGIEARCVTEHPDFAAVTNTTVLQQVGPLLRGKTGRKYKYPGTGSRNAKNEAVAYRWLVRWIFGYLG